MLFKWLCCSSSNAQVDLESTVVISKEDSTLKLDKTVEKSEVTIESASDRPTYHQPVKMMTFQPKNVVFPHNKDPPATHIFYQCYNLPGRIVPLSSNVIHIPSFH